MNPPSTAAPTPSTPDEETAVKYVCVCGMQTTYLSNFHRHFKNCRLRKIMKTMDHRVEHLEGVVLQLQQTVDALSRPSATWVQAVPYLPPRCASSDAIAIAASTAPRSSVQAQQSILAQLPLPPPAMPPVRLRDFGSEDFEPLDACLAQLFKVPEKAVLEATRALWTEPANCNMFIKNKRDGEICFRQAGRWELGKRREKLELYVHAVADYLGARAGESHSAWHDYHTMLCATDSIMNAAIEDVERIVRSHALNQGGA